MGMFGHNGWLSERSKAFGHSAAKTSGNITYELFGYNIATGQHKKEYGAQVGYDSNNGVTLSTPYYGPNANKFVTNQTGYNYGNARKSNTTAYRANAAGTANKIAQGGMTKDDILKYNAIHPNEIAGDNPANNTALNTNTALRGQ